jgi:hypothetical protein
VGDTSALGGTVSQLWSFEQDVAEVRRVGFLPSDGREPRFGSGFAALVTDDGSVCFSSSTETEGGSTEVLTTVHRLLETGLTLVEE